MFYVQYDFEYLDMPYINESKNCGIGLFEMKKKNRKKKNQRRKSTLSEKRDGESF